MVDLDILKAYGSTNERLREVFTAVPEEFPIKKQTETKEEKKERLERSRKRKRDVDLREKWRKIIQSTVEEGIVFSLKSWRKYAAVDVAWDSAVITKMQLPLLMYAQGKINVERCATMLSGCKNGSDYVRKDEKGNPTSIELPRFIETQVNLIRSIISRRHAAQKNKYGQLWPFYDYEARGTSLVAKCRADVLSQRVDIMADQYGYRHHDEQVIRDAMLYAHSVDFPRRPWEWEKQYRKKSADGEAKGDNVEAIYVKEGIAWFNPHPTRIFWDNSYPLSSLNEDNGCQWVGNWDVMRFSDIEDDPAYFNKRAIGWGKFWGEGGAYSSYLDYFNQYYTIIVPGTGGVNPAAANDRKAQVGFYSGSFRQSSVFVTNLYSKIVPKDMGIGDYPYPVWVHKVVASDSTVIYAEFMPSSPCAVLSINESDSRQVNVSMADDLMSYQDQMTNLLTELLMVCQIEVFKAIGLDSDQLSADQIKYMRAHFAGENWASKPLVFEFSRQKAQDLGQNPKEPFIISETRQSMTIQSIFEAMIKLLQMVERLIGMSPAEQGQPAPREISATEVTEIANTTSSIYSAISNDIDKFRAAKKRIIYESMITCQRGQVECPVKNRYTAKTVTDAGFQVKETEDAGFVGNAKRFTVIGTKRALVHDYIFTTRDGDERAVNTQSANTLTQLIGLVLSAPMVAQRVGREKLYEMFNEVFRLSGAGIDLKLEMDEADDNSMGLDEITQLKQAVEELGKYLSEMAQMIKKNSSDISAQEQVNEQQQQALESIAELAEKVKKAAGDIDDLFGRHDEVKKILTQSISYKDAPAPIQAQMEAQAGYRPATDAERLVSAKTKTSTKTATAAAS